MQAILFNKQTGKVSAAADKRAVGEAKVQLQAQIKAQQPSADEHSY